MSASLQTRLLAAQYDALRRQNLLQGPLVLAAVTETGYVPKVTITDGWWIERETNRTDGSQHLVLFIVETDANVRLLMTDVANQISAGVVGNWRYKIKSFVPPQHDPREWRLLFDPTGEAAD